MSQVGRQESILTTGEIVAPASPPRPPGQPDSHLCPFRSFRQFPPPQNPQAKGLGHHHRLMAGVLCFNWPQAFPLVELPSLVWFKKSIST